MWWHPGAVVPEYPVKHPMIPPSRSSVRRVRGAARPGVRIRLPALDSVPVLQGLDPVVQQPQSRLARLLRVELRGAQRPVLDGGEKPLAVL